MLTLIQSKRACIVNIYKIYLKTEVNERDPIWRWYTCNNNVGDNLILIAVCSGSNGFETSYVNCLAKKCKKYLMINEMKFVIEECWKSQFPDLTCRSSFSLHLCKIVLFFSRSQSKCNLWLKLYTIISMKCTS